MARNLSRSSSGTVGSCPSSSTRRLNSSHVISRLKYSEGSSSVTVAMYGLPCLVSAIITAVTHTDRTFPREAAMNPAVREPILADQTHAFVRETAWQAAVLPFGATEPHNLHMPYGTDTFQVEEIARRAC